MVRYGRGQQFALHHDSSAAFQRRLLTLLVYLNDVDDQQDGGETWFPFANNDDGGGSGRGSGRVASQGSREAGSALAGGYDSRAALEAALSRAQRMIAHQDEPIDERGAGGEPPSREIGGEEGEGGAVLASRHASRESVGGLRVVPRRGRAILFYNLDLDTGEPAPGAIHAALPFTGDGDKWIANFWVAPPP